MLALSMDDAHRDDGRRQRLALSVVSDSAERPLDGILVADFSRVLAGPLATMTLADLGAE